MAAVDLGRKPGGFDPISRLDYAQGVIEEFIQGRQADRIGLVVFAGRAFTRCPLTLDYGLLSQILGSIEITRRYDGTAIGMGLATSVNRLKDSIFLEDDHEEHDNDCGDRCRCGAGPVAVLVVALVTFGGQVPSGTNWFGVALIVVLTTGLLDRVGELDLNVLTPARLEALGEQRAPLGVPLDDQDVERASATRGS